MTASNLTGVKSRDFLLALAYGLHLKQRMLKFNNPDISKESWRVGSEISMLGLVSSTLLPSNVVSLDYIDDAYLAMHLNDFNRKTLKELLKNATVSSTSDEVILAFRLTAYNSFDLHALQTILKDYDIVKKAAFSITEYPFNSFSLLPIMEQHGVFNLYDAEKMKEKMMQMIDNSKNWLICSFKTTPAEIDCFIDIVLDRTSEKELLKKHGEQVLSQFIGKRSDPFVEELLQEKLDDFSSKMHENYVSQIDVETKIEKYFLDEVLKATKTVNKLRSNPEERKIKFSRKVDELVDYYSRKIRNAIEDRWEEIEHLAIEMEEIRKNIQNLQKC